MPARIYYINDTSSFNIDYNVLEVQICLSTKSLYRYSITFFYQSRVDCSRHRKDFVSTVSKIADCLLK